MNALAWYYEQYEKNYQQAVLLWEQADELQSPDAPLNLGVMYANGLYPGKAANQVSTNQSGAIQKYVFCARSYNMYIIFILAVHGLQVLSKGCSERKRPGSNSTCWHLDHWHSWLRTQTSRRCCFVSSYTSFFPPYPNIHYAPRFATLFHSSAGGWSGLANRMDTLEASCGKPWIHIWVMTCDFSCLF